MNDDRFFTEPYYGTEIVSDKKRQKLFEEWKERLASEWQNMPGWEGAIKDWEQHVMNEWDEEMMAAPIRPDDDMTLEDWAIPYKPRPSG